MRIDACAVHLDEDPVLAWNQQTLDLIQADAASPPYATRALAMESIAVFDVLNAINGTPAYMVISTLPTGSAPPLRWPRQPTAF